MTESGAGATAATRADSETTDLRVHFLPDYTDANPYQDRLAAALAERGVAVRTTGGGGGPFPILSAVLADGRPDVVHVHFLHQFAVTTADRLPRTLTALLCIRVAVQLAVLRVLGVSLVWTAHDLFEHERRAPGVEAAFKHVALRFLFDRILVHCERATASIRRAYRLPATIDDRTTVVPHGNFVGMYPDDVSRAEARESLDLPADGFVFGFFGAIRRYKGVPRLVETFREVAGDGDVLLVAGRPRTEPVQRSVEAAVDGDDRVRTTFAFVPDDEVQLYLRAADVVVLPFRTTERSTLTSGSALLAMGFGRPVVAPDVGCVGELVAVGDGFVYDPGDDDGLATAMRAAMAADDRPTRERRSRAVAAGRTWERAAEATHQVYAELAGAGTGH